MNKEIKSISIKAIIFITVCIISAIILKSFEPSVNLELAMNQINGGSYEFAELNAYNQLKDYILLGYIIFFLLLYSTNISRVIKKVFKKNV